MMRRTSICVHGLNDASDDDVVLDAGGGGSPAVADRTSRTSLSKNTALLPFRTRWSQIVIWAQCYTFYPV